MKSRAAGKGCSRFERDAQGERPGRLRAGHEERVEHPRPLAAMVGEAAEEQGRPTLSGGDVEGVGRLGPLGLGGDRGEQGVRRRVDCGSGQAQRQARWWVQGSALGEPGEPGGVEVGELDLDLQGRPARPEPEALAERGEPAVVAGVVEVARRGRLGEGRAAVVGLERGRACIRLGAGLPSGPTRPPMIELLAEPGGLLGGATGGRGCRRSSGRWRRSSTRCSRVRSRIETAPERRGRPVGVRLAGDPGEAEGGQVDDGPDAVLGELGGAERPFGAEVGRGVGQEDPRPPGHADRVEDEIAGPALRVPSPTIRRARIAGFGPDEPVEIRPDGVAPAGFEGVFELGRRSAPPPNPARAEARAWRRDQRRRAWPGRRAWSARAAIGEGSRRAAAWAR